MRSGTIFAAIVVAALCFVGTANAGTPDGIAGPWADYVVDSHQGCAIVPPDLVTCVPVRAERSDPTAALGPAESPQGGNDPIPVGSFYSLGLSGLARGTASITLGFDNPICNTVGNDLAIDLFEITREVPVPYPNETVQVYVSANNVTYVFAGTVTKDGTVPMPASVPVANFVRLIDISRPSDFANVTPDADGYDLDGVRALATNGCPGGDFGKLEICKSSANGMAGRTFMFSLNGGTPISVKGGRCTGAITAISGANRIVELQTNPPTDVSSVSVRPSSRSLFNDLPNRTAVVFVPPGATAANETMVTFTNEPAGGNFGDLKICKLTAAPAYIGRLFSFRVNNGPLISTEANPSFTDPSTWICRIAGTFQVGSIVTVQETIPDGAEVQFIDTDPGANLVDHNTDTGTAKVLITGPAVTVLFDNEPIPPPQAGWIEVCKDAALVTNGRGGLEPDPFVVGPFDFTITPPDGNSFVVTTFAGQCTAPFRVAAGIVRVTEHAKANHSLVEVFTIPSNRLLFTNLINRTADVEVPVGDVSSETQVHFVNQRDRAELKVCKTLGPGSGDLVGMTFNFTVTSAGFPPQNVSITAAATTQCVSAGQYPVGHDVTVVENLDHGVGQPGEFIDTTGGGTTTIGPGINQVDFTNTARGAIQVCKDLVAGLSLAAQPTFQFRIDGGAIFVVKAGICSPQKRVSVGNHTVTEIASANFEVTAITVNPPSRLVGAPDLPNRTVTVSVPFGAQGETVVRYTNSIRTGTVKVCKRIPLTSVATMSPPDPGRTYTFNMNVQTAPGNPGTFMSIPVSVTLEDGALEGCSGFFGPFPVLQSDGTNTIIGVSEGPSGGGFVVDDILLSFTRGLCSGTAPAPGPYPGANCIPGGKDLTTRNVNFFLAPGPQFPTFLQHAT